MFDNYRIFHKQQLWLRYKNIDDHDQYIKELQELMVWPVKATLNLVPDPKNINGPHREIVFRLDSDVFTAEEIDELPEDW